MAGQKQNTTPSAKKRIVKDYDKLPEEVLANLKLEYPYGFSQNLISYTNAEGKKVSALPYETTDIYYLIRMTVTEAERIIEEDEDYDDAGNLREDYAVEDYAAEVVDEDDVDKVPAEDDDDPDSKPANKDEDYDDEY